MITRKLFKLLQRVYRHYTREQVDPNQWKQLFEHVGENTILHFPANISVNKGMTIGDNTTIWTHSRIQNYNNLNNNPHIYIGNRCYIGYYLSILNASTITIGDDVLIASHVLISSENHGIDPESETPYMDQQLISKPVTIGDGCWIGEKVCILPGVTIGKKCIIGAGSVVTKSIPDYSIAVGNPAKVIKQYNFESHKWERV